MALALFLQVFGSWAFARKINKEHYGSWWLILFLVSIVFFVEVLGAFGVLTAQSLLFLSLGFFAVSLFCLNRDDFRVQKTYSGFAAWVRGLGWIEFLQKVLVLLFFVGLVFVVGVVYRLSPLAEIDSIGYHLPIMYNLVNTHGVWDVFHAGFVGPNTFFPANHEALMAFFTIFSGDLSLNFLVNLSGILLFYLAVKDFIVNKKNSSVIAMLPVIAITSVPFLFKQVLNFQVDLLMFGLFGSAVAFLFSALINHNKHDLAKFFLVTGFLVGTKYNGVPQAVMFLPLLLPVALRFKNELKSIIWMPILTLLPGIFWYVRNFIVAGNPIYPFGLNLGFIRFDGYQRFVEELANTSILDFMKTDGVLSVWNRILQHHDFGVLVGVGGLLCFVFATLVLVSGVLIVLIRKKHYSMNEKSWYFVCVFASLYLFSAEMIYYVSSPYTFTLWGQTIRYASAVFAMIPVILVLSMWYSKVISVIVCVFSLGFLTFNIFTNSFIVDADYRYLIREKMAISGGLSGANAVTAGIDADDVFLIKKMGWYKDLLPFLKVLREEGMVGVNGVIEEKIVGLDNLFAKPKIALVGLTPYWLFIKEGYVPYYVNVDGCAVCKYYDYRDSLIRDNPDEDKWGKALRELGIQYLLIDNVSYANGLDMLEEKWAKENTKMFQSLYKTEKLSLYKIVY